MVYLFGFGLRVVGLVVIILDKERYADWLVLSRITVTVQTTGWS